VYIIKDNDGFCHCGDGSQVVFVERHALGG
jgi:hypothetical protein